LSSPISVLVVSYIFPPVGEVGAKRIASFCRYFPEAGVRPIVLTAQEKFYSYQDGTALPPAGVEMERTTVWPTPLDFYRRWKTGDGASATRTTEMTGSGTAAKAKMPTWLQRNALALLQTPDPYWGWYFPAINAGVKLIQKHRVAAIFSSGPPWISHMVARALKKKSRLAWFADFRDPWGHDPHQPKDKPGWKSWAEQALEASCVLRADRILCNTDRLRALFLERYSGRDANHFLTLTNGFEDVTIPADLPPKTERRTFLHVGWLYAQRRVDTFCQAIVKLIDSGHLERGTFEVVFLGHADPVIVASAQAKTPELFRDQTIRFEDPVSWSEAQRRIWSADFLLAFQGSLRLEIPAKIFEYIPTGKPILAIVKSGALSDLLDSTGLGTWADPDDPNQIAKKIWEVVHQPPRSFEEVKRIWSVQFHFRSLTERLAHWIREVACENARAMHQQPS
jgi:glycosyltransferase involved in cell wall biosynthesis